MLPTTLLPDGMLDQMRSKANEFMTQPVEVYSITTGNDMYGNQIAVSSGLVFATSGYVGAVNGSDQELLRSLGLDGSEKQERITVLVPFGNQILNTYIVRTQNKDWRVIWSNADTQNSVQIYEKAICALYEVIDTKRWLTESN